MSQDEFRDLLRTATTETLALTRQFIVEPLPDDCRYRVESIMSRIGGPTLDEEALVDACWHEGTVPCWINLIVWEVNDSMTILHVRHACDFIDPDEPEWQENFGRARDPAISDLLPFSLRVPPVPRGWRVMNGIFPDIQRSLEVNGKYHLPKQANP